MRLGHIALAAAIICNGCNVPAAKGAPAPLPPRLLLRGYSHPLIGLGLLYGIRIVALDSVKIRAVRINETCNEVPNPCKRDVGAQVCWGEGSQEVSPFTLAVGDFVEVPYVCSFRGEVVKADIYIEGDAVPLHYEVTP
jgi:hypothetical protein